MVGVLSIYINTRDTKFVRVKKGQIVDFTHSMTQSGLPILTFYQGKTPYNFLMDTGSNASYVNQYSNISINKSRAKSTFIGADGVTHPVDIAVVKLFLNDKEYECPVSVADLDASFKDIKSTYGITLHGIIGTDFMNKYNYCIDFLEYVVYQRAK